MAKVISGRETDVRSDTDDDDRKGDNNPFAHCSSHLPPYPRSAEGQVPQWLEAVPPSSSQPLYSKQSPVGIADFLSNMVRVF